MKRLLAYSSIAHVGYMLLGVMSAGVPGGPQAVWLYMFTYLLMQSGAFAIIIFLQGKGVGERIEDFRGLGRTRPLMAFAMMVILLSLAGVPPLVGFFSKFFLFKLAIEQGHVTLTVIALLTSAVAAYYYLAVVALMYFKDPAPEAEAPGPWASSPPGWWVCPAPWCCWAPASAPSCWTGPLRSYSRLQSRGTGIQ
jgi:NADH-quinone oxidoreductase subunit N